MNLEFKRIHLDGAMNAEGVVVQGIGRELMEYERDGWKLPFEVFVKDGVAVVYKPWSLPSSLPAGMTEDHIYAEIRAGVAVATESQVEWKTG